MLKNKITAFDLRRNHSNKLFPFFLQCCEETIDFCGFPNKETRLTAVFVLSVFGFVSSELLSFNSSLSLPFCFILFICVFLFNSNIFHLTLKVSFTYALLLVLFPVSFLIQLSHFSFSTAVSTFPNYPYYIKHVTCNVSAVFLFFFSFLIFCWRWLVFQIQPFLLCSIKMIHVKKTIDL